MRPKTEKKRSLARKIHTTRPLYHQQPLAVTTKSSRSRIFHRHGFIDRHNPLLHINGDDLEGDPRKFAEAGRSLIGRSPMPIARKRDAGEKLSPLGGGGLFPRAPVLPVYDVMAGCRACGQDR